MALTDIETVRLKTSDRSVLRRSVWAADGESSDIKLDFRAGATVRVWLDSNLFTEMTDYTLDTENGVVHLNTPPVVNATVVVEFDSFIFTDEEVQVFLDEASGNTTLASAFMLYAWSADASRLARKESAAGGGGFGSVTLDTAVRARELREAAKGYAEQYQLYAGTGIPVEMLTQVGWTEATRGRMILRELLGLNTL